jgi:hypothetical protein
LAYTLTSEIEWMTWLVAGRLNPVKLSFRWVHGHVHTWQCKMEKPARHPDSQPHERRFKYLFSAEICGSRASVIATALKIYSEVTVHQNK